LAINRHPEQSFPSYKRKKEYRKKMAVPFSKTYHSLEEWRKENEEERHWISDCCGAKEDGDLDHYGEESEAPLGLCRECKDHASFHVESDDDYEPTEPEDE
tara:strand:+ start:1747 stop:2049 length:303 start_codon:yes stop_codon:yes gene_type:complete